MEDFIELIESCEWSYVDDFDGTGAAGFVGVSIYNLNEIFLPCGGKEDGDMINTNRETIYWSASSYETPYSFTLSVDTWKIRLSDLLVNRYDGCLIRPIQSNQTRNRILITSEENKSISQIFGLWNGNIPTENEDRIAKRLYDLYNIPVKQYTISDVAFLIRQNFLMEYVVPIAIDVLKINPFIMTDFYRGDLLIDLLQTNDNKAYWDNHIQEKHMVLRIIELAKSRLKFFDDITMSNQRGFLRIYDLFGK